MNFIQETAVNIPSWIDLLRGSEYASPFQTPEFYRLYNNIPGFSAEVFAVEESEEILALCIVVFLKEKGLKRYFSRRAIIYGGPLLKDNSESALVFLMDKIISRIKNRVIYTEIRNFLDYGIFKTTFEKLGWIYIPYLNYRLNLQDRSTEDILAAMKYNRRREIRQSFKEGVVFQECKGNEDVVGLYHILKELYKVRVKLPVPDLEFYMQLYHSEIWKVFVVKHKDIIIGGCFCIILPGNSLYTMYYCGIRNYHPRIFATDIAIWAALEYAVKQKIKVLDLMGAGQSGKEYGVREYKAKFGGELVEYGRYVKVNSRFLYKLGKLGLYISSKLKK